MPNIKGVALATLRAICPRHAMCMLLNSKQKTSENAAALKQKQAKRQDAICPRCKLVRYVWARDIHVMSLSHCFKYFIYVIFGLFSGNTKALFHP